MPPALALSQRGPVIQVAVSVEQHIAEQLLRRGEALPPPITGLALIDTGASSTCIDEKAARKLKLPVVDVARVASASHASTEHNVHPIQVEVTGLPIRINAPRAIAAPLEPHGLVLLIGRDMLSHCTLFYNGPTGQFTLSI